jgi:hypothetical protein
LPQRNRFQQFVRATQKHTALIVRVVSRGRTVRRRKRPLTVLANYPLAKILDSNLKPPTTGWAFLHEVRGAWHYCKLLFDSPFR